MRVLLEEPKVVSKEELHRFVKEYPRELDNHVIWICEPELLVWCDHSKADKYPGNIVASYSEDRDGVEICKITGVT